MDKVVWWLRRLRANPWWFDSALALAAAGLSTALFVFHPAVRGLPRGMFVLGCGLVLLHTLPLAARRRLPLAVLATSVASGLAFAALGLPPDMLWVAVPVAVYSVAAYGDRWVALAGLVVAEVGLAVVQLTPGRTGVNTWVGNMGFLAATWLLGHFVGIRRLYVLQLEERTAELERAREELARRAVAEERLRLARELHDVVAHAMSVIAVQSGVGAHVADSRPEEVGKALGAIEATSRGALEELRRLLGVLRQDSEPQASLTPVPAWPTWRACSPRSARPGWRCGSGWKEPPWSCQLGSTCPPTGSSRRP
jgi:signal transduction histidine kinase